MRTIQIKRGTAANTPTFADGELGLQMDAGKLVVGNGGKNLGVVMDKDLDAAKTELTAAIAERAPASHTHTKAYVGLSNVDNVSANDIRRGGGKHLAGQGTGGGYSFVGDSGEDTGMFSNADGDLYFMTNAQKHPLSNFVEANSSIISNINNEISNLKTSVANGKAQIASAISDKGVSTGADTDFGTMANHIRAIATAKTRATVYSNIGQLQVQIDGFDGTTLTLRIYGLQSSTVVSKLS